MLSLLTYIHIYIYIYTYTYIHIYVYNVCIYTYRICATLEALRRWQLLRHGHETCLKRYEHVRTCSQCLRSGTYSSYSAASVRLLYCRTLWTHCNNCVAAHCSAAHCSSLQLTATTATHCNCKEHAPAVL